MTVAGFEEIKQNILRQLQDQLPVSLTYHNASHTADVLKQAEYIAKQEGIDNEEEMMLLKIAALFHDTGFLQVYKEHEMRGCLIMREQLQDIFDEVALEKICGLIMATKLPQTPLTHLEEIICDADLDYLGRTDFFTIGDGLRSEFLKYNIIESDKEWDQLQVKFLTAHRYHTESSRRCREEMKQANIAKLP